jgi:hypothetical protein
MTTKSPYVIRPYEQPYEQVKTGDLMYFPPKMFHDIKVKSERIKLLVIHAPFMEAPVMRRETAAQEAG